MKRSIFRMGLISTRSGRARRDTIAWCICTPIGESGGKINIFRFAASNRKNRDSALLQPNRNHRIGKIAGKRRPDSAIFRAAEWRRCAR